MKKVKRRLNLMAPIVLIGFCIILLCVSPVNAKHKKTPVTVPKETKSTFMVMPELSASNIGGSHLGYFNVKLKADQAETLRIKVYNPTNRTITIHSSVQDATTVDNGGINYLGEQPVNKQLLPNRGSRLVTIAKQTKLHANETRWIKVKIAPIKHLFNGQKAMAINLSATQSKTAAPIRNRFVYAIGLVLNGEKLQQKQYHYINSPQIKTRFVNKHQAAISIKIANPDPRYLMDSQVSVTLKNQKWSFVKYENKRQHVKVAPNSDFYDDLLLGGKRLVPGVYQMTLSVKDDGYHRIIHKYVKITKSEASYINRYNYEYLKHRNWIIGGCIVVILVLIVAVWISLKRKKDLNENISE